MFNNLFLTPQETIVKLYSKPRTKKRAQAHLYVLPLLRS